MKALRRAGIRAVVRCIALGSLVFASPLAWPGDLTIPNTFVAGSKAVAADVNANFTATATAVNSKQNRVTGTCATGSSVSAVNADGTVVCDATAGTAATAVASKQDRVTGTCTVGNAIRAIAANGTVTCQSTTAVATSVASVAALAGVPRYSTIETRQGNVGGVIGRYMSSAGSDYLVAPIAIPHGATVTSFSFSCVRNNAAACIGYFYRTDSDVLASASIAAQAAGVQTATATGLNVVIDNTFGYFVYMSIDGTAGIGILPVAASVTYTLP
jgi:hypothetical protein